MVNTGQKTNINRDTSTIKTLTHEGQLYENKQTQFTLKLFYIIKENNNRYGKQLSFSQTTETTQDEM